MRLILAAPDIVSGDAVGNHCLSLVRAARRIGMDAFAYARNRCDGVLDIDRVMDDLRDDDTLLISYSIFDPSLEKMLAFAGRKIVYYHGVTPSELLVEHDPVTAEVCARSSTQYPLFSKFQTVMVNSSFSARSLSGYISPDVVRVVPPVSPDMSLFAKCPKDKFSNWSREKCLELLVVGRVVPHKRIEDAISLVDALKKENIEVRLTVVGSTPHAHYLTFLNEQIKLLKLESSIRICGMVSEDFLHKHFVEADALISMSLHEGFYVPLLEAMHFGLPVFIRNGTASEEIGGDAVFGFDGVIEALHLIKQVVAMPELAYEKIARGFTRNRELLELASDHSLANIFKP